MQAKPATRLNNKLIPSFSCKQLTIQDIINVSNSLWSSLVYGAICFFKLCILHMLSLQLIQVHRNLSSVIYVPDMMLPGYHCTGVTKVINTQLSAKDLITITAVFKACSVNYNWNFLSWVLCIKCLRIGITKQLDI